ncbi:MAG: hypothetical protein GY828_00245 [Candidatus Gracilibacteria bacterium]|nr:hypothetical protein [Candidatus Gracilibacteria bacterium]
MQKIVLLVSVFILCLQGVSAGYTLEKGSQDLVDRFELSEKNLGQELSREDFVNSMYEWYSDYRKERGLYVDYENYSELDNEKIFTDVDLDTEFGKKIQYFAHLGAFSKNKTFDPKATIDQKTFFIVMNRLKIMWNLQNCKNLRICEQEADTDTYFTKGVYYRYISKVFNKKLRKYHTTPKQYIDAGYKPLLSPNFAFPNARQTLNGCYAFSVRNILKYKHGIGVYIPKIEKHIGKKPKNLWYYGDMNKYDTVVNVKRKSYYYIDTLIHSLQVGEPVSMSYMLEYYSYKEKKYKHVAHIVAAYSFDEEGVWVAETVSAQRKRIPWSEMINRYGGMKMNRIFKYQYNMKSEWSEQEIKLEKENNFLAWEK